MPSIRRSGFAALILLPVVAAGQPATSAACADFDAAVNGPWRSETGASADPGPFATLAAQSRARQLELLDRAARGGGDPLERLLGGFWSAAIDDAAVAMAGGKPLAPLLGRIAKARKPRDLAAFLAESHAAGLPLLFDFGVGSDLGDPSRRLVYFRQAGLGLPDRDYYLRADAGTVDLRRRYIDYVSQLLMLTGSAPEQAPAEAVAVVELETRLARASLSLSQLRDPASSYHRVELDELSRRYPNLRLKQFARTQELKTSGAVSLAHTAFFVEADALLAQLPVERWHSYLRFHVGHALAPHLSPPFRDANSALVQALSAGARPRSRTDAMLATVDALLGDQLGALYARRYLDPDTADAAEAVARAIVDRLDTRLAAADWLGAEARAAGRAKLAATQLVFGAADDVEVPDITLSRSSHVGNVLALSSWRLRQALSALDQPLPRRLQGHEVSVWYDPVGNRLAVSAAMLQPPVFDPLRDAATNFGALGALLAHELSHGFDLQGSRIDAAGRVQPWWSESDSRAFVARTGALANQYGAYEVIDGQRLDGQRSFLENVADLAGLELALGALRDSGGLAAPGDGAELPLRRFFRAWASLWDRQYAGDELRLLLASGVHPPARFRVLGPLANLPAFAEAWDCTPGQGFTLPPERRVRVWD